MIRWRTMESEPKSELTPREKEYLSYLVEGRLGKEIAIKMGIDIKTVELYASNARKKLKCRNRIALIVKAAQEPDLWR